MSQANASKRHLPLNQKLLLIPNSRSSVLPAQFSDWTGCTCCPYDCGRIFEQVGDVLTENDFYATRHKYIFRAIEQLSKENSPYDAVLVHDWLIKQNLLDAVGGEEYLMQLMADSPSSFYNLETYAGKIKEFSTLRSMIKVSSEILQNAYDTKGRPVSEILDLAETNIFRLPNNIITMPRLKAQKRLIPL